VFDSAKGWLANHKNIQWQNHGRYYLKGIDEAIEIYEVLARENANPKAPLHGNKQRSFPKLLTSVILVLVTVAITAAVFYLQKAEVYFVRFYPEAMYLDNSQPIALAGEKSDQSRKVITDIKRGKHIVHYEVTHSDRYYADLDIQRGINNIELKFKELRLPSVQRYVSALAKENKVQEHQTFSYALYDNHGDKIPFNVDINLQLSSYPDGKNTDLIHDQYAGAITVNGKAYDIAQHEFTHKRSDTDAQRSEPVLIYEDDYHAYYYKYRASQVSFEFEVYAVFKPVRVQQ
jgi:hypothetical protein